MNPFALAYYALVCGTVGLAAPRITHPLGRFALGVAVGLAAATLSPVLRRLLGAG